MLSGNAGPLQASNWHSVPLGAIGPRRLGARAQARAGPALLVSRKHLQVLESITASPGPPPPPPPPPPPLQRKAPTFLTVPGPGLGCCEQCKVACPCPGACPVRPPLRGRSRVSSRDLKPGRPRRSGSPKVRSCARWRYFCSSAWKALRAMRQTHALHCERRTRSWRRSSWRAMRSCLGSGRSSRPLAPPRRRARKDVRSAQAQHVDLRPMGACKSRIGGVKVAPPRRPRRRPLHLHDRLGIDKVYALLPV
jgi:hypothetical protein